MHSVIAKACLGPVLRLMFFNGGESAIIEDTVYFHIPAPGAYCVEPARINGKRVFFKFIPSSEREELKGRKIK